MTGGSSHADTKERELISAHHPTNNQSHSGCKTKVCELIPGGTWDQTPSLQMSHQRNRRASSHNFFCAHRSHSCNHVTTSGSGGRSDNGTLAQERTSRTQDEERDTQVDFAVRESHLLRVKIATVIITWTHGARTQVAATAGVSHAASPLKPAPSAVQTALHVSWTGAQRRNGQRRWKKTGSGPDRRRSSRYCKAPTSSGRPVLGGGSKTTCPASKTLRIGPSTPLQSDRARSKHARRRLLDRKKELESCEEGRAPPRKSKSKHLDWQRVFGSSDVPKALSEFCSTVFEFPNTVTGQKLRQAEDEHRKRCVGTWRTRIAETPTFKCDEEFLTNGINMLKKDTRCHSREILSTQHTSARTARRVHHRHAHIIGFGDSGPQTQRA